MKKPKTQPKSSNKTDVTMLQKTPRSRRGGNNAKTSETRAKFLEAFEETFGNVTASCLFADITRMTFYRWMSSRSRVNLRFQKKILAVRPFERQLDLAEAALMRRIALGDTAAITFLLRTKGKERGYGDQRQELEFELTLRAVQRIENIITQQISRDPDFKPDLKRFAELAAADFGVKPEAVEKEFLKRQPQILDGVQ